MSEREWGQTRRQARQEAEDALRETRADVPQPSWDEVRAEDREEDPQVLLVVRDEAGEVVRRVEGPVTSGVHRVAWDLRYPRFDPTRFDDGHSPWGRPAAGPMVVPGRYTVQLGAFGDYQNALEVQTRAAVDFPDVKIESADGLHRVRIGLFTRRADADDMTRRLRKQGFDAVVVPLS